MKAWEIIAWTYGADIHCPGCAREKHGALLDDPDKAREAEVNPVFASDDTNPDGEFCGTCGVGPLDE